jgi:DNA-binding response OmpR family regulator
LKVLVIEDDPGTLEVIRVCFEIYKPEVTIISSSTGRKGIQLIEQEQPDAVIIDLGLPDIDGNQVIEEVRRTSSVPMLVSSARAESESISKAMALGSNDYIVKPFDPEALVSSFEKMVS